LDIVDGARVDEAPVRVAGDDEFARCIDTGIDTGYPKTKYQLTKGV